MCSSVAGMFRFIHIARVGQRPFRCNSNPVPFRCSSAHRSWPLGVFDVLELPLWKQDRPQSTRSVQGRTVPPGFFWDGCRSCDARVVSRAWVRTWRVERRAMRKLDRWRFSACSHVLPDDRSNTTERGHLHSPSRIPYLRSTNPLRSMQRWRGRGAAVPGSLSRRGWMGASRGILCAQRLPVPTRSSVAGWSRARRRLLVLPCPFRFPFAGPLPFPYLQIVR